MDNRHLWLRSKRQHAIVRVRHTIIKAVRDFFDGRGFTLVDAPIFTPNACEGTSNLFETDYHGDKAYLTQSGQLYMEAAAAAFGSVVLLRADVPRREEQDASAPGRVLDGRAGGRVPRPRRRHAPGGGFHLVRRRPRARDAPRGAEGARARHLEAREGQGAVPAHHVRRRPSRSCRRTVTPRRRSATTSVATKRRSSAASSIAPSSCTAIRWS